MCVWGRINRDNVKDDNNGANLSAATLTAHDSRMEYSKIQMMIN